MAGKYAERIKELCREKGVPKTPCYSLDGSRQIWRICIKRTERRWLIAGWMRSCGKPTDIPELLEVAASVDGEGATGRFRGIRGAQPSVRNRSESKRPPVIQEARRRGERA